MGALTNSIKSKIDRLKWKLAPGRMQRSRLDAAVNLIKNYPETQFLLQLATAEGIKIHFDPKMRNSEAAGMLQTDRETGEKVIALSPDADAQSVALTLIHELRHAWQDKVLGITPQTRGKSEPDVETTIILNRVREADAYAFTNLIVRRMQAAAEDDVEARGMVEKLQKRTGGKPPDQFQLEMISEYMTEKFISRIDVDHQEMVLDFAWALRNFDSYDRRALVDYHARYTSPHYQTEKRPEMGQPFGLGDIRKMLVMGIAPNMPAYLGKVPDELFRQAVLQDMTPSMKNAMGLIKEFEKVAKRGISQRDNQQYRTEIETTLSKAVNAPPAPHTEPRFG